MSAYLSDVTSAGSMPRVKEYSLWQFHTKYSFELCSIIFGVKI